MRILGMFWNIYLLKTRFKMSESSVLMRLQGQCPGRVTSFALSPCYATERDRFKHTATNT